MAIIVEDGTGKTDSNSYVTEAEVTTYATNRGITLTASESVLIYKAMDYLETLDYIGDRKTEEQALQWPRDQVYIDNYYIEPTTIPKELKNAQLALCMSIDAGNDPMATVARATSKEKVGDIEVTYQQNASSTAIITSVNAILEKLLEGGGGLSGFKVSRG